MGKYGGSSTFFKQFFDFLAYVANPRYLVFHLVWLIEAVNCMGSELNPSNRKTTCAFGIIFLCWNFFFEVVGGRQMFETLQFYIVLRLLFLLHETL